MDIRQFFNNNPKITKKVNKTSYIPNTIDRNVIEKHQSLMKMVKNNVYTYRFYSKNKFDKLILESVFQYLDDTHSFSTPDKITVSLDECRNYSLLFKVKCELNNGVIRGFYASYISHLKKLKKKYEDEIFQTILRLDPETIKLYMNIDKIREINKVQHFNDNSCECSICLETYTDDEFGDVVKYKLKHCGHTFCFNCVDTLKENDVNKCPLCRQYFTYNTILDGVISELQDDGDYKGILKLIPQRMRRKFINDVIHDEKFVNTQNIAVFKRFKDGSYIVLDFCW
jgi:hypothetical protein